MSISILKRCTGCGACVSICPYRAILMVENSEGFLVPKVDKTKCTNCGLCDHICPMLNNVTVKDQYRLPKVYAGWNKNEKVRLKSSSGGVFSVLAEYFLNKKGYVCGAAFDNNNRLRHIIISNKKDLKKLRGSKYVQSEVGDIFGRIKILLDKNKWVLFSGTPCQAAGLRSFLRKDYERLLVVDLVCHGVPSPKVFRDYINEVEKDKKCKISQINFRDKSTGWESSSFKLVKKNGGTILKQLLINNEYGEGFLKNLFLRQECSNCKYIKLPRISDITLGDFWGISNYLSKIDAKAGISLILINNIKGYFFIRELWSKLLMKRMNLSSAAENNYPLCVPSEFHVNRDKFFSGFKKTKVKVSTLIKDCINDNFVYSGKTDVGILNFHWENRNFGANLVTYALSEVVRGLGYSPYVINYFPYGESDNTNKAISASFYNFRNSFLKRTIPCNNGKDLFLLNNRFNNFIVGSDQVWRKLITGDNVLHYFLDFAHSSKNLVSYGASFGHNYWDGDDLTTKKAIKLLKRFSAISVREKSGKMILSDIFQINDSVCVLDPTLLLTRSDYDVIINTEIHHLPKERYLAYYFLFDDAGLIEHSEEMKEIANYLELKIINIRGEINEILGEKRFVYNSVSSWLNYIKNSDYVVTDSYHGVLFAIIYGKNFICLGKKSTALSRFENIFSLFSIKSKFFASLNEIKNKKVLLEDIDYKNVYKILSQERDKSIKFLSGSLKKNVSNLKKIKILETELNELKFENEDLLNKLYTGNNVDHNSSQSEFEQMMLENESLQLRIKQLNLAIESYKRTKTFRYSKKIKKLLIKFGIKKFKL